MTNNQLNAIIIIANEKEVKFMWIERTDDKSYPYMVNNSWAEKPTSQALRTSKGKSEKLKKKIKKKVLTNN